MARNRKQKISVSKSKMSSLDSGFPKKSSVLQHTFHFDPTFEKVHLKCDSELKFFCEMFSLIDSFRKRDMLYHFTQKIEEKNGVLECDYIIDMLKHEELIEPEILSMYPEGGVKCLVDSLYQIVDKIIADRFISCMQTSNLGCLAWEMGQLYNETAVAAGGSSVDEHNNNNSNINNNLNNKCGSSTTEAEEWEGKARCWLGLGQRLHDLAKYQHAHIKIHHDFQKRNYAPDPRTNGVYGSTVFGIVMGLFYMVLSQCSFAETGELFSLLSR